MSIIMDSLINTWWYFQYHHCFQVRGSTGKAFSCYPGKDFKGIPSLAWGQILLLHFIINCLNGLLLLDGLFGEGKQHLFHSDDLMRPFGVELN